MSDAKVNQDRPLVTFALFAYNQERYIREAVEGAFAQTYEPLEIILSDDCSNDRTFEIMQEMAATYEGPHAVSVRRNAKNVGFLPHINIVLTSALGSYICWAAGDDISLAHRVSSLMAPMLGDHEIMLAHSAIDEIDLASRKVGERRLPHLHHLAMEGIISREHDAVTQASLFHKDVFDKFGPFNSDLTSEGPVIAARALMLGRTAYIDEPTVLYRVGSGTSTSTERTLGEPIKITGWRLSALRQIEKDMRKDGALYAKFSYVLNRRIRYFENLLEINKKPLAVGALARIVLSGDMDKRSLRAFARRAMFAVRRS